MANGHKALDYETVEVLTLNMMELVKKTLAFGMGAAAFSAEKMKQFADEMVARGEMTSDEAGKFVDDMSKRAEDEKHTAQEWMREQISKMLQQMGAAESARVEALERRVAKLEERIAGLTGEPQLAETPGEAGAPACE